MASLRGVAWDCDVDVDQGVTGIHAICCQYEKHIPH